MKIILWLASAGGCFQIAVSIDTGNWLAMGGWIAASAMFTGSALREP